MTDARPLTPGRAAALLLASLETLQVEAQALGPEAMHWHPADGEWCLNEVVGHLLKGGPQAHRTIKELVPQVHGRTPEEVEDVTTRATAAARTGKEGQEGLRAFLERRRASWAGKP